MSRLKTTVTVHENKKSPLMHKEGVTYFTREGERKLYFFLTLFMLLTGILYKFGVF